MDPLLALRQTIRAHEPITYLTASSEPCDTLQAATTISLGPNAVQFPKTAATRFLRPSATAGAAAQRRPEDFFTLQAVVLAYVSREASTAEYLRLARDAFGGTTAFVSVTDRTPLVEWLEGKSESLERLVPAEGESTTPLGSPSATTSALPSSAISPSRAHAGVNGSSQVPLEKRPYVPDAKDIQAVKKIRLGELEIRDRNTVLRGTKANDFTNVKNLIAERVRVAKEAASKPTQSTTPGKTDPNAAKRKNRNISPIIMISSSPTALITMYNVRKFLEDSEYETPEDAKRRMAAEGNHKLDDVLPIYRRKNAALSGAGGKDGSGAGTGAGAGGAAGAAAGGAAAQLERPIKYFVVDGVEALGKFGADAWDRVICVMTTGQAWQFKPYKWQDPTQLFHHVKGIHVAWANDPVNPKVKDWNVTDLKIDKNRRHVDKMTVANFWMQIDDWVLANKPWLPT